MRRRPLARAAGALGVFLAAAATLLALSPAAAATQPTGKVRLGHLSPATATVDITLVGPQGTSGTAPVSQRVGSNVGYGAVTDYLTLVPGRYRVDLRPSGAEPTSTPAVSSELQVAPEAAQSLFFFDTGPGGLVRGQVVDDDLAGAPAGEGRVRLVQGASSAALQALAVNGPRLATNLAYGTVTDYAAVAAKTWGVRLSAGADTAAAQLPVGSGSVNTVVVTTDWTGKLAVTPLVDVAGLPAGLADTPEPSGPSTGAAQAAPSGAPSGPAPTEQRPAPSASMPKGGVPAGAGGSTGDGPGVLPIVLALAAAPLLAYSASSVASRRRHG